jgi:hypothetical protein
MKTPIDIRRQLVSGEFEVSRHAFKRAVERNIHEREIKEAAGASDIIEDYPDVNIRPVLLLGFSMAGRALHFQVSFADTAMVKIITIYEPDPNEWIDWRKRR